MDPLVPLLVPAAPGLRKNISTTESFELTLGSFATVPTYSCESFGSG